MLFRSASSGRFEKIARGDNRVHECVGEGLVACSRSQMIDHGRVLRRGIAIFAGQKIAGDYLDLRAVVAPGDRFDPARVAGGPGETAQIAHAAVEQILHELGPDETGCARYRDVHGVLSSCSVSRVQAETPENVGVGVRVAAVERITVMNLDHGIESAIVSGRPFDNFLAQYIRLEQQREVDPPDRMLQDVVRCQAAGLISGQ